MRVALGKANVAECKYFDKYLDLLKLVFAFKNNQYASVTEQLSLPGQVTYTFK